MENLLVVDTVKQKLILTKLFSTLSLRPGVPSENVYHSLPFIPSIYLTCISFLGHRALVPICARGRKSIIKRPRQTTPHT